MSHIEILLPFGLPPAELASDLLRGLAMPALAMLLARANPKPVLAAETDVDGDFARSLPHEVWLARRFGMAAATQASGSPPLATGLMHAMHIAPTPGHWFIVQPVHFHIARDHLVLADPRNLAMTEADSRALFAAARPVFEEAGLPLQYGNAVCWFTQAARHRELRTATPDATCGHNIDIWMPQGASAREWRKLQNEVQMEWHAHAVNDTRAAAGEVPVNSLWLWGGAEWPTDSQARFEATARLAPQALFGFDSWFAGFAGFMKDGKRAAPQANAGPADVLGNAAPHRLLLLDELIGPALANDWSQWLQTLQSLEARWFAPLVGALAEGRVGKLTLVLSHGAGLRQWSGGRHCLRKFWVKPALARLMP